MKQTEFVALMALLMSLVALSIDMLLPALPQIAADFAIVNVNKTQYIISAVFVGMIIGQLSFGPLSDAWGRKPAIHLGLGVFLFATLICFFASNFSVLLAGRILQGVGVASSRIVTMALIRDKYEGRAMARIMSFVMMLFILVPAIAPALGQLIMQFTQWRGILVVFMLMGGGGFFWFALRQTETLAIEDRQPLSIKQLLATVQEIITHRAAFAYTIASGLVFASFIGYLVASQQVFDLIYQRGEQFPYYFGLLALTIGGASLVNAKWVMQLGMRKLSVWALIGLTGLSLLALLLEIRSAQPMPFILFMAYCLPAFFCVGVLFANLNALAMAPLGHIAGVGAGIVGAISTLISVVVGAFIGQQISADVLPMLMGFLATSLLSLWVMAWAERK